VNLRISQNDVLHIETSEALSDFPLRSGATLLPFLDAGLASDFLARRGISLWQISFQLSKIPVYFQ
jgi:hypothetical protein